MADTSTVAEMNLAVGWRCILRLLRMNRRYMETYPSVVSLTCDLFHRRAKIVGSRLLEEFPPIPCWLPLVAATTRGSARPVDRVWPDHNSRA